MFIVRGLRSVLLASSFSLALSLSVSLGAAGLSPAQAATGELRGSEMGEGYGRIVLSFDAAPKTSARISNGVLIVSFSEPSTVATDRVMRDLPTYVAQVRTDPDSRGMRFALNRPYRINVMEAGEKVFIDLLPENWKGILPGLPKDVVEELTRRARQAEVRARDVQRTRENDKPVILGVKGSQTAAMSRILFNAPSSMPVVHRIIDGQLEVSIDQLVAIEPSQLRPLLPEGARIVSSQTTPAGLKLVLSPPDDWQMRAFREDDSFVVDFVRPRAQGSAEQELAAAAAAPKAMDKITDQAKPAAVVSPAAAKAAMPEVAAHPPQAAKPAQAADMPSRPQDAPKAEERKEAAQPVKIAAAALGDGMRLDFDFTRRTGAAAFENDGLVTMVFDSAQGFDPAVLQAAVKPFRAEAEIERQSNAVIIRLSLPLPQVARLSPDGLRWSLTLGENAITASEAVIPQRGLDDKGQTVVSLPLADISAIHWISQPGSGLQYVVVTAHAPARGIAKPYRFVEFDLLPSAHGAVIAPRADDVIVRSGLNDVMVSRNGGLMVSLPNARSASEISNAAKSDQLVDRATWTEWRLGATRERLREAGRRSAEAPRQERSESRLRLAAMLLANDLASEAMGPLNVVQADDPAMRMDKRALLMRGMAQSLMGRDADALTALAIGPLKDDIEAGLWRALSESRLDRHARALPGFRRAADILEAYPDHLQALFRPELIRSAIAMREFSVAEREHQVLNDLPRELANRDQLALMRALIDESAGRPDAAIQGYKSIFSSERRPIAAEAQLRGSLLALREKNGAIPADEAIARLETVSVIWRGDEIEATTLGELGRIYAEKLRWRDAFSVAKRANEVYPDHPVTRGLHDRTAAQFEDLFATGKSDSLPRVEALALFYDFKEFLPIGRRGDEIIRRLSDRLVELDLLDQAAELLQHQIDKRLTGAARATVAARLAMVRLMNNKPAEALAAIVATRMTELPADVRRARLLLEAKTLSDLSRTDLALEILTTETGPEIERLRADIYWTGRRWRETGESHERILGEAWRGTTPLGERERRDVMRAAMAYVMSDEALSLDRLRTKFSARMSETPDARSFAFITGAKRARSADMRELARSVASADTVSEFMSEYRKRYPQFSAVSRKPQVAEGGAMPPQSAPAAPATPQAQGQPAQPAKTPG